MKTVFKSDEIAHIWANAGAPRGRSPGNLSFDGDAIKSYATVIGRRIRHKGKVAYVLDRAGFSITTSAAQSRVARAIPLSEKVFTIRKGQREQSLNFTPATLAKWFEDKAREMGEAMPSRYAHKRAEQWREVTAHLESARDVLSYFGFGTARLDKAIAARAENEANAAELLKTHGAKLAKAAELKKVREAKAQQARNIRWAENYIDGTEPPLRWVDLTQYSSAVESLPEELKARFVAAVEAGNARLLVEWRNGVSVSLPYDCPVMLRAEAGHGTDGPEMVTSKGARVPLSDARRTYNFAMKVRAKGWHKNGEQHKIGAYQLDAVNEQGIVAGCHRVTWAEIDAFAASQNWSA